MFLIRLGSFRTLGRNPNLSFLAVVLLYLGSHISKSVDAVSREIDEIRRSVVYIYLSPKSPNLKGAFDKKVG